MVDTAFGELPTPLVASMADAGSNTGSNQQMNPGAQAGTFTQIYKTFVCLSYQKLALLNSIIAVYFSNKTFR